MADDLDQLEADLAQIEVAMRHVDAGDMDAFAAATADLAEHTSALSSSALSSSALTSASPAEPSDDQPSEPFANR